jgi:hypothetical protein
MRACHAIVLLAACWTGSPKPPEPAPVRVKHRATVAATPAPSRLQTVTCPLSFGIQVTAHDPYMLPLDLCTPVDRALARLSLASVGGLRLEIALRKLVSSDPVMCEIAITIYSGGSSPRSKVMGATVHGANAQACVNELTDALVSGPIAKALQQQAPSPQPPSPQPAPSPTP